MINDYILTMKIWWLTRVEKNEKCLPIENEIYSQQMYIS